MRSAPDSAFAIPRSAFCLLHSAFCIVWAIAQPLNGTYTIKPDGSGDFLTFVDAASALVTRGVSGHVIFEAYDGVYDNGTVDMRYANTSGKTVTFRPASGQAVVVGAAGASVLFWASGDLGAAHNIKIEGLKLANCTGWGACCPRCNGWRVSDCQIETGGGVWFGGGNDSVYNCNIRLPGGTGTTGIGMYFAGSNDYAANNFVSNASMVGVYALNSAPRLYFNTVITDSNSGNSIGFYNNGSSGTTLKCNIFVGTYRPYYSSTGVYPANSNYNDWYRQGGDRTRPFEIENQGTLSLDQWCELTRLDTQSLACDPLVIDKWNDLHLRPESPCIGFGAPYAGITTDFDRELRDSQHPDIGADEYYPTGVEDECRMQIAECRMQIAPNPASNAATVSYTLPKDGNASLKLYNAPGRLVATLVAGWQPAGSHSVPIRSLQSAVRNAPGVYLVVLESDGGRITRKLTLD